MNWKYEEGRVYGTDEDGGLMAEATFSRINDDTVDIDHTYVATALRGNGVAAEMMGVVARYLRDKGLKAVAVALCAAVRDHVRIGRSVFRKRIPRNRGEDKPYGQAEAQRSA
jgi:predicted GNAT family acetyltransferase